MRDNSGKKPYKHKNIQKPLDFNCDLAQCFGVYTNDSEFELLDYISSVNVAAGFHAGDPSTIKRALLTAKEKNVVIGAHIGFDDIQGFGRREMVLSEDETEALVIYQLGALMSFAKAYGLEVEHVRPHGAMYKMASENFAFSCAIAKAIKKTSKWLTYYGAAGDVIRKVADYVEIPVAQEIKLDKVYDTEGRIVHSVPNIYNTHQSVRRLNGMLKYSQVDNDANGYTNVEFDTVHFSHNAPNVLELAKRANEILTPTPVTFNRVQESGWV